MVTERREHRINRQWLWAALGALAVIVWYLMTRIALPYFIYSPGTADAVEPYVQLPADKDYRARGQFLFTTVSFQQATPGLILWAWLTPNNDIESRKEALGTVTTKQYIQLNTSLMDDSKKTAISLAFRRAGLSVTQTGDGAAVVEVTAGSPAQTKLNPGDVITAVNRMATPSASNLATDIQAVPVGTDVQLDVKAPGGSSRKVVLTVAKRPSGAGTDSGNGGNIGNGGFIGVSAQTVNARLNTAFPVGIDTQRVGGPSAGLAFTLTLLDELTPGDLTGGKKIAVTGTIDGDGNVGPVGGVVQKTAAVRSAGGSVFLVPSDEYQAAKAHAGSHLKIVKVDTLDQALDALRANGGDVSGVPAK